MSKPFDYESIDPGTMLELLSIPALTRVTLARFAGATDDFNPMHLDDKVAATAGKDSVFAPNNLVMAYVGRMLQRWLVGASLRRYGLRMLRLVWPGDVLTCRGVVVEKRLEGSERVVSIDVWADNQRGETVAKGRALAVVPKDGKKGLSKTQAATGVVYHPSAGKAGKASAAGKKKAASKKTATKKTATKKKAASKKKTSK